MTLPQPTILRRATVEIGWALAGIILTFLLGAIGLGVYNLLEGEATNARVERIVIERQGDRREFWALIDALRHLGLRIPKGVVTDSGIRPHGLAAPAPVGAAPTSPVAPRVAHPPRRATPPAKRAIPVLPVAPPETPSSAPVTEAAHNALCPTVAPLLHTCPIH